MRTLPVIARRGAARRAVGFVAVRLAAVAIACAATRARSSPALSAQEAAALREQRAVFKRIEADLVCEPARLEWAERRERARELRKRGRSESTSAREAHAPRTRAGARSYPADSSALRATRSLAGGPTPRNPDALGTNVRVNPPPAFWTQAEVSVASIDRRVMAAWNDGSPIPVTGQMSYGYSLDGGQTWRGGLPLPLGNGVLSWESDPVLVADPKRGEFWFAALAIAAQPPVNTIGVLRGTLTDTGMVWSQIGFARNSRDTLCDKPWLAVDTLSGAAMLSYTSFYRVGLKLRDQIEFQHSEDGGATWSPRLELSATTERGLVQGSRPAIGPDGAVHVVWGSVDTTETNAGLDFFRVRTSHDGGRSFDPPSDVAAVVTNFASGAPGYNRHNAINFPSIAVDRGDGPHRGRVYVTWMEAIDYFQPLLTPGRPIEGPSEPGQPPIEIEIGDQIHGVRDPATASDLYTFHAHRGETAIFFLDSLAKDLTVALGVGCGADPFELAYSDPPSFGRERLAIATFPRDGDFLLAVGRGSGTRGAYHIRTGWVKAGETRGRDVRDVFEAHSDDGRVWSEPVRVNDSPPWFDDWLPELAVGPTGNAYLAWYDWKDSPTEGCGMRSNVYLSRSVDGGASWQRLGSLSDQSSDWGAATSNQVPNQGDYIGLTADTSGVSAGWADARGGTPDVYFAHFAAGHEPPVVVGVPVSLESIAPNPLHGGTSVDVSLTIAPGTPARLELWDVGGRRVQEEAIEAPAPPGLVRFTPHAGLRSGVYLLRVVQGPSAASARIVIVR